MIISAIIYLILHLIPNFLEPSLFWGIDSWSYYPKYFSIPIFILAILLILFSNSSLIIENVKKLANRFRKLPFFIWIIFIGIIFIIFSQKLFLLGDGLLRIRNTQGGYMFSPAEPMDTWLHSWLYNVLKHIFDISASDIFAITSILSGIFSLIGVNFYLKKLFPESFNKRFFIGLSVFLSGSVQLFFGYVESYSIMACFVLLFLFSAIYHLEEQSFSISTMLFLSLAVIFHPMALLFLPSAIYFYIIIINAKKTGKSKILAYAIITLVFLLPPILMIILFLIQGYDLNKFFTTAGSEFFLPMISTSKYYGVLSLEHFIDVLNLILLTTPSIIGIFLIKRVKYKSKSFLLISTVILLVFTLIFKPDLGFARDWDLFSLLAFPLTLFIANSIVNRTDEKKHSFAFILIAVSLFHTIPWIYNNSNEDISLKRAEIMANTHYWSSHSKAILFDELAQYYYNKKELNKALDLMKKAYENEQNERLYYSLGVIYNELGLKDSACSIFEKIKSTGYMNYNINLFLGNIYYEKGRLEDAENCYEEVLKINPQNENVAFNLGLINYTLNKLTESSNYFKIALRLNPNNIETLKYLGQIYFDLKNYKDALRIFQKADVLEPKSYSINYYIALCYANLGFFQESIKYLEKAKALGLDSASFNELRKSIPKNY